MIVRPIVKFYAVDLGDDKIQIRAGLFQMKLTVATFSDTRSDDEVAQRTAKVSHKEEHEELERLAKEVKEKASLEEVPRASSPSREKAPKSSRSPSPAKKKKVSHKKIVYEKQYNSYSDSESDDDF
jgi:hypothetical protein